MSTFDPRVLAETSAEEREALERFITGMREAVTRPAWSLGARKVALAEYLAVSPGGDEQSVVDELSREILAALGWSIEDWQYNDASDGESRPDFQVFVPDPDRRMRAFIVEDKATTVRDFTRSRPGTDESPLAQLRRYVLSTSAHARAGLLCNGHVLEAWRFDASGPTLLARIDLPRLGAEPLGSAEKHALAAVFGRFSRSSFADAVRIGRRFRPPPLPPEQLVELQAAIAGERAAQRVRDLLSRWWEAEWRATARDVRTCTDELVEALRNLIERFTDDVRHQLDESLVRAEARQQRLSDLMKCTDVEVAWAGIERSRRAFGLPDERWTAACLEPLRTWARDPTYGAANDLFPEVLRGLGPHVCISEEKAVEQPGLFGGNGAVPVKRDARRKEVMSAFKEDLEAWRDAVLTRAHARAEILEEAAAAQRTAGAYKGWEAKVSTSVLVGATQDTLRSEFARQTAYVYLVRLLLVRICEDKGLFARKLSDGALIEWEDAAARYLDFASGASYDFLTQMAYACAASVYAHFYGATGIFDWYSMDEKMLGRALAVLNDFDLQHVDTDIIGTVYGRYLLEGKHDQGRYYTPPAVVETMLDLAGWKRQGEVGRRLADLACGSGSFLVAGARRVLEGFRGPDGLIPDSALRPALDEVQRAIWGIDINPFACYLAETNLIIQVLDLVKRAVAVGEQLTVDRFNVYCDDALLVNPALAEGGEAALHLARAGEEGVPDRLKARLGRFSAGFDVLVGNPPYVRADAESPTWLGYRAELARQHWFTTAHLKWDLYVPFVEQYARLLSDAPEARACLITIESLGTAPYAEKLRAFLKERTALHDVVFAKGLALFSDAAWQDNLVWTFSRGTPGVVRRWRSTARQGEKLLREPLDAKPQAEWDAAQLFVDRPVVDLDTSGTLPWEEICYVTVGMVLNSDEKLPSGTPVEVPAAYDPALFREDTIEDRGPAGKTIAHRVFGRDEVVANAPDSVHTRRFLGSREVLSGGLGAIRWLEYGEHTRVPQRIRRPTFPELYESPKVMFGTFTGVAVDDGSQGSFLMTSDSVRLSVRWHLLAEVENNSLREARRGLGERYRPEVSEAFSEWYLCALALSQPIQRWLASTRRSMKDHVYPDDIRRIPVKALPPEDQAPFIALARALHQVRAEQTRLAAAGFSQDARGVRIPTWSLVEGWLAAHPEPAAITLIQAQARRIFQVQTPWLTRDLARVKAQGSRLLAGKELVAEAGAEVQEKDRIAAILARLLAALPATFAQRQILDQVPGTEAGWLALGDFLDAEEARFRGLEVRAGEILAEIDRRAWDLYRPATP